MIDDREIDRRQDDGEGERKGGEQRHAAEHEPGLVAVPDRRDRVHHQIARAAVGREAVEDADAEVEAVEQHIEKHADAEHQRPDRNEIENRPAHARPPVGGGIACDRRLRPSALDDVRLCPPAARPAPRDAQHQRDARGEHDDIDDGVGGEGDRDVGAGQRRRHGIGGAQEPVDRPGLAADFGRRPAGEDGEKAERGRERAERAGTSPCRTARPCKRSHQLMTTISEHDEPRSRP